MQRRQALRKTVLAAGSVALAPALMNTLASCQQQDRLSWQPVFLNDSHAQLLSSMVDAILPRTETPGGIDLKVDIFIDSVFGNLYTADAQDYVVSEMDNIQGICQDKFNRSFSQLDTDQRTEVLTQLESSSGKFNGKVWGTAVGTQEPVGFYRNLKSMILWGYFTTEKVGEEILSYDPIPGEFKGCIPLSDVGNAWSL